ncbi:MAG: M15 family metallopeptidase [Kofleriaceae bacterium]
MPLARLARLARVATVVLLCGASLACRGEPTRAPSSPARPAANTVTRAPAAAAPPAPPAAAPPAATPPAATPPIATPLAAATSPGATAAAPPRDEDLIELSELVPSAVLDLRYATTNNFTKRQLYPAARCLLRRAVASRLARVAERLRPRRLVLWDCYRPASIQRALWELVPDPRYVARPKFAADGTPTGGSRHSRGAAVDVSLATEDGAPIAMPTDHDDFSAAASRRRALAAPRGGAEATLLSEAMIAEGFAPIASEWWHFDAPDSARYGFSDEPLPP